jgi:hypothetical protein
MRIGGRSGRQVKPLPLSWLWRRSSGLSPPRAGRRCSRKVYEVDPMVCPRCSGKMKVVAFITDFAVVDKIIDHLKLSFVAERPPPSHIAYQEVLMAAEASTEYSSWFSLLSTGEVQLICGTF